VGENAAWDSPDGARVRSNRCVHEAEEIHTLDREIDRQKRYRRAQLHAAPKDVRCLAFPAKKVGRTVKLTKHDCRRIFRLAIKDNMGFRKIAHKLGGKV
jgi:hypothetical protein